MKIKYKYLRFEYDEHGTYNIINIKSNHVIGFVDTDASSPVLEICGQSDHYTLNQLTEITGFMNQIKSTCEQ